MAYEQEYSPEKEVYEAAGLRPPNQIMDKHRVAVKKVIRSLGKAEREVFSYRYGIYGGPALSVEKTAEMMGFKVERVIQVESIALVRLKDDLRVSCLENSLD